MLLKHASDVPGEPVERPGFSGMTARYLLTSAEGCPRYAVRLMEFAPGGYTAYHQHQEEHEMFFVLGQGEVIGENKKKIKVRAGDALFIKPCEFHQVKNTGKGVLTMVCTVPMFPGMDGRRTTPCNVTE